MLNFHTIQFSLWLINNHIYVKTYQFLLLLEFYTHIDVDMLSGFMLQRDVRKRAKLRKELTEKKSRERSRKKY